MGVDAEGETATKLESIATVLTGPWGWAMAAAAVGLGFIIDKMATARRRRSSGPGAWKPPLIRHARAGAAAISSLTSRSSRTAFNG